MVQTIVGTNVNKLGFMINCVQFIPSVHQSANIVLDILTNYRHVFTRGILPVQSTEEAVQTMCSYQI